MHSLRNSLSLPFSYIFSFFLKYPSIFEVVSWKRFFTSLWHNVKSWTFLSAECLCFLCVYRNVFHWLSWQFHHYNPSSFPGSCSSVQFRTFCFIFLQWLPVYPFPPHSSAFLCRGPVSVWKGRGLLLFGKVQREMEGRERLWQTIWAKLYFL